MFPHVDTPTTPTSLHARTFHMSYGFSHARRFARVYMSNWISGHARSLNNMTRSHARFGKFVLTHSFWYAWHARLEQLVLKRPSWHDRFDRLVFARLFWRVRFDTVVRQHLSWHASLTRSSWHVRLDTFVLARSSWHACPDTLVLTRWSWHARLDTVVLWHA